jgi:hypothetical protein
LKSQALWLPGDFPTTNKLLDLTRASGFYTGKQVAEGRRARGNERDVNLTFRQIREATNFHARGRLKPVDVAVPVLFVHFGSGRRDPSSWYLAAKAIEDGLVDAKILRSDRFYVTATAGRCVKADDPMWRGEVERLCDVDTGGREGMLVMLGVPDGLGIF